MQKDLISPLIENRKITTKSASKPGGQKRSKMNKVLKVILIVLGIIVALVAVFLALVLYPEPEIRVCRL
jgi:cell division protein FtsL